MSKEKTSVGIVPTELDFQGTKISCPIENGHKMLPVKTICTILDVDYKFQDSWLKEHPFFSQLYKLSYTVGADGKQYQMNCLSFFDVTGWVCSLSPNNRKERSIEKQYQFLAWLRERTLDMYKSIETVIAENKYELEMVQLRDQTEEQLFAAKTVVKELNNKLKEIEQSIEEVRYSRFNGQLSMTFPDVED